MTYMEPDSEAPTGLNLAERIRRLANGRTTLDVAQFQFIGLAEIRGRYAERWPEKRDKVGKVARHFISRRIAPDDVLISGADGFLLVFGGLTGVHAESAAQRISKELNAFFLGEPELCDMHVTSRHHAMTVDDFAEVFGAILSAARETPMRASPDVAMGYTPIWDAERGALATHFISPLDPATGLPMDWDQTSHRHADMDERKLVASEADMRALFASGASALVGVAMHVSTLNNQQSLARMVQAMAKFDERLQRYRVMRVSCVDPGYPRIYLEDIMRAIRPYAARIAIGLNWTEPDIASVLKLKPAAIGFTLPPGALGQASLRNEIHARISTAVEQARSHGVKVGVEGDLHPEHALQFMREGVSYMCSPRIWQVRQSLTAAEAWPRTRLEAMVPHAA